MDKTFFPRRFVLIALLISTGCAIGPDYKTPEIPVAEKFAGGADATDGAEAETRWWSNFKDPLLDELITEAATKNHDVRQALSRINEARAIRRQSLAELLPGAQVSGSYEKSLASSARFPSGDKNGFHYEVYNSGIDALWELDIFGRLRRDLEAKNASLQGSVASLQDVMRMVISEVASTYVQLRGAQQEREIIARNITAQEETLKLVQTKVDLGEAGELDAARARSQLESTRAALPTVDANILVSIHRLGVLLGKDPEALREKLETVADIPNYQGPVHIGAPANLLRRRPDIRMSERDLASQTALIGVAIGDLFPKIELSGSVGVEASDFSDLTRGAGTYKYGPQLTWSPFDVGRLRARVTAQNARTEEALAHYEQTVLRALEDTENSLAQFSAERERRDHLHESLIAATRAHELATEQYHQGVTDFLTVLDAQRSMLESEDNFVRSQQNVTLALVGIYKALGGGWEDWGLEASK